MQNKVCGQLFTQVRLFLRAIFIELYAFLCTIETLAQSVWHCFSSSYSRFTEQPNLFNKRKCPQSFGCITLVFSYAWFRYLQNCSPLSVPVKYMREATPYVKKGSPVSEIGWETPPPESPRLGSPHSDIPSPLSLSIQGDRRYIPLKMCYITRSMTVPDPENRYSSRSIY